MMNLKELGFNVVTEGEYQDCIRVADGYLLVVNKFFIDRNRTSSPCEVKPGYFRKLNKGLPKSNLYILTKPIVHHDEFFGEVEYPIGQVLYNGYPIVKNNDPSTWTCYSRVVNYANWTVYKQNEIAKTISKLMDFYMEIYS